MLENATLSVTGPDAADFLQAQLTADVNGLGAEPKLAAWCNPKGRVIALFHARRVNDEFRLALPAALAESVQQRLLVFRFRSKVEIEIEDADAQDLGVETGLDEAAWRGQLIARGVPWIGEAQREEFTPHMLNLDLVGAVDFDKGCYPGQEIVARTHYRGATKRRLRRFSIATPPAPGDKVQSGDRDVGDVVNVAGQELLAVVPVDAGDLSAAGSPLTPESLPYSLDSD